MRHLIIFSVAFAPLLSACVTMEPVEFTPGHPAHAQTHSQATPREPSLLRSHSFPNPDKPLLDRTEFVSSPATPVHEHGAEDPTKDDQIAPTQPALYTCPMHPEIVRPKPGNCPICGMALVPTSEARERETTP